LEKKVVTQKSLFDTNQVIIQKDNKLEKIKNIIQNTDTNNITPMQALEILNELKNGL
jgi:hypothetical protein